MYILWFFLGWVCHQVWHVSFTETDVRPHAEERDTTDWWIWDQQEGTGMEVWEIENESLRIENESLRDWEWEFEGLRMRNPYTCICTLYTHTLLLSLPPSLPPPSPLPRVKVAQGHLWTQSCNCARSATTRSCLRRSRTPSWSTRVSRVTYLATRQPPPPTSTGPRGNLNWWTGCCPSLGRQIIGYCCSVRWRSWWR